MHGRLVSLPTCILGIDMCKQMESRVTYTTTKPIAFVVTKSSSKDSAALSANTQCFKSRPVRKAVNNQHCKWTVAKTLSDPYHRSTMYMKLLDCIACVTLCVYKENVYAIGHSPSGFSGPM